MANIFMYVLNGIKHIKLVDKRYIMCPMAMFISMCTSMFMHMFSNIVDVPAR